MAQTSSTITMPLPTLTIKIKIKLPRAYGLRMWVMTQLIGWAAWVGPHDIEVEVVSPTDDA